MVTVFVYAVLAVVVVAALVALAVLVLPGNEELAPAAADRTPWALPAERAMTGPDVGRLRLPVTLRGYRFAETDAVLDRLGEEIAYRDSVIETLRSELENREPLADPAAEVLADAVELDAERDDLLVELGETPEETEGEMRAEDAVVDAVGAVGDDAVVDDAVDDDAVVDEVVVVAEADDESVLVEVVEVVEVVEPEPEPEPVPQVIALDDELPELDETAYPDGPDDPPARP